MSISIRAAASVLLFVAFLSACHTSRPAVVRYGAARASSTLSAKDLATINGGSAYDAVKRLRPHYLVLSRSGGGIAARFVYVDGIRLGADEALRGIPVGTVQEIRLLDSREATLRFGTDHSLGAIVVVTKAGP